jgi:hypothetical protein
VPPTNEGGSPTEDATAPSDIIGALRRAADNMDAQPRLWGETVEQAHADAKLLRDLADGLTAVESWRQEHGFIGPLLDDLKVLARRTERGGAWTRFGLSGSHGRRRSRAGSW